ncbi:MAG: hypothetical protein DIU69_06300 [Bacillota bacterium]|nr:MAG: hypothetical protein DIU69_06300 [Bacillota bacterium]
MMPRAVRWFGVGLRPRTLEHLVRLPGWIPMGFAPDVPAAPPRDPVDLWLLEGTDLRETLRRGKALQPLLGGGRLCVLIPPGAAAEVWRAAVEAVIGGPPEVRAVDSPEELAGPGADAPEAPEERTAVSSDGAVPPTRLSARGTSRDEAADPESLFLLRAPAPPPAAQGSDTPAGTPGSGRTDVQVRQVHPPRWPGAPLAGQDDAARLAGPVATAAGAVVAVVGPKGGVGRTWLSCELAAALAAAGERVALVDADWVGGDAAVHLDLTGGPTILDLQPLVDGPQEDWEEQWLVHPRTGLRLLAAPPRPELAALIEPGLLAPVLSRARHHFHLVLVDCPADDRPISGQVADTSDPPGGPWRDADRLLLVTTPAPTSLRQARAWLERRPLPAGRWRDGGAPQVDVVVNCWDPAGPERRALEDYLGHPVCAWLPEDAGAVESAIASGVPLVLTDPSHPLAVAVRELAGRLLGRELPGPGGAAGGFWRGLAQRMRRRRAAAAPPGR